MRILGIVIRVRGGDGVMGIKFCDGWFSWLRDIFQVIWHPWFRSFFLLWKLKKACFVGRVM